MPTETTGTIPRVSVVIITRNQRSFLERSLPAIAGQTNIGGPIETIVVDSGSTDGALTTIQASGARLVDYGPLPFRFARAYNLGFARARAQFVIRLSGDAVPADSDWLRALLAPLKDVNVCAVWGRQILPAAVRNPIERRFESQMRGGTPQRYCRAITPLGSSMAIRRDLWQQYAFDERLPQAEDYDWLHHWTRRGNIGVYTPDAVIAHGHDESIPRALRRSLAQSALQARILLRR